MKSSAHAFRHIVFFRLHKDVTETQKEEALACLHGLGSNNPEIIQWTVTESRDTRKGRIIIENALFTSEAAFNDFRTSLQHTSAADTMRKISDWWVGDYLEIVSK